MRRAFCLLAPLFIIGYLYAQWTDWFSRIELASVWKRPLFSEPIDLEKPGPIEWVVPRENWIFQEGEADLALSMNLYTLMRVPSDRSQVHLRVKVRAEGRVRGGEWQDRSIHEKYFKTDEPFSKDGLSLWESQGLGRLEYGLARLRVVADEELRIVINVLVPDGQWRWGKPQLMLVGTDPQAHVGFIMVFRAWLRGGGFWLSICLVIALARMSWQPRAICLAAKHGGGDKS